MHPRRSERTMRGRSSHSLPERKAYSGRMLFAFTFLAIEQNCHDEGIAQPSLDEHVVPEPPLHLEAGLPVKLDGSVVALPYQALRSLRLAFSGTSCLAVQRVFEDALGGVSRASSTGHALSSRPGGPMSARSRTIPSEAPLSPSSGCDGAP